MLRIPSLRHSKSYIMASPANELFKEEPHWEEPDGGALHHVETRAESPKSGRPDTEPRHSSATSTSTRSTDNTDGGTPRGRRTRPSITSASASLATVRERDERRAQSQRALSTQSAPSMFASEKDQALMSSGMSSISSERPSALGKVGSEENVVSSKKVTLSDHPTSSSGI